MIVDYTESEIKQMALISQEYNKLISECESEIERLKPDNTEEYNKKIFELSSKYPDPPAPPEPIYINEKGRPLYDENSCKEYKESEEYKAYELEINRISKEISRLHEEWESAGSEEWKAALRRRYQLIEEEYEEHKSFCAECEKRAFNDLHGDKDKIKLNAKEQINRLIINRYNDAKVKKDRGVMFTSGYIRLDGDKIFLDPLRTIEDSKKMLHLHFDFFKDDDEATGELYTIIFDTVENNPHVSSDGKLSATINYTKTPDVMTYIPEVVTNRPDELVCPVDKVSEKAFNGETGKLNVRVSNKKSSNEIKTLLSIDFNNENIKFDGNASLTLYDREVYNAIISLYVDGKNEYITPQMIYQTMTGNKKTNLTPKNHQYAAINESIKKLMYVRMVIDASEEAKAFGIDMFKYEGPAINAEKITASMNGTTTETLHILKEPTLYTYAARKNQIGRIDIGLLNSPVNKTEEIIVLQGYLYRRILTMKRSKKMSNTIVYNTIYEQIGIPAGSDNATKKKKYKIREATKRILTFWKGKEQGFISGYSENKRGKEYYSINIEF